MRRSFHFQLIECRLYSRYPAVSNRHSGESRNPASLLQSPKLDPDFRQGDEWRKMPPRAGTVEVTERLESLG
jgi:hypothetical protein